MQDSCGDCLSKDVCDITGASCQKMGALFTQRKQNRNGRTAMSNAPKNVTPKTVTDAAEKNSVEEPTVPAQKTGKEDQLDKVLDNAGKVLFSGTRDEVRAWLLEQPTMVYAVRQTKNNDLIISTEYVEEGPLKLTLVQRLKAMGEKLQENKKALAILGASAAIAGLAIKNSRRKAVSVELLDPEDTTINGVGEDDENTDSL